MSLNTEERQELTDILDYLQERLEFNGGRSPEGNAAAIINGASPKVREVIQRISQRMETPRDMPFTPKKSEADWADALGLDVEDSLTVKAALDGLEVNKRLIDRLGGADKPDTSPPTRREQIEAAVNASMEGAR